MTYKIRIIYRSITVLLLQLIHYPKFRETSTYLRYQRTSINSNFNDIRNLYVAVGANTTNAAKIKWSLDMGKWFFFRFQWYQGDDYVSNLVLSSVTVRDTRIKYSAKDCLKKYGIPMVITSRDESLVGINNIGFGPLRDFISTRIGLLAFDNSSNVWNGNSRHIC